MIKKYTKFSLSIILLFIIIHFGSIEAQANFTDVTSYEKEINYLTEKKITNGYSDGTFKPENTVTRIQAARMLIRELNPTLSNLPELQFYDIATNNSDYETIQKALALSIFTGKKDANGTYFDPYTNLTRAQLAKVFVEAYGLTKNTEKTVSFKDVPEDAWYKEYVEILASNGIVTGYEDQTFRPNESLKRKHFAAIYYRFLNMEKTTDTQHQEQADEEGIVVFGLVQTDDGKPLKNTNLTFTSNQHSYKAVTDDNGDIEIRLPEKEEFIIEADGLKGAIKVESIQEVTTTFEHGNISFGTDLSTNDTTILLAPASRYIDDLENIESLSEDLTSLVVTSDFDIQVDDVLIIDGHENAPSGVALKVTSIKEENGLLYIETEQPTMEEVYTELVGNFNVSVDKSDFVLPEGATYANTGQGSTRSSIRGSLQGNPKISFNLANISANHFEVASTVELGADFEFDIDWRVGLNPVNSMHFQMRSFANLGLELSSSNKSGCYRPWKQLLGECIYPLSATEMTFPVGIPGITVALQPFLEFDGYIEGSLKSKLETTQNVGIQYTNGKGTEELPSETFSAEVTNVEASGSTKATVKIGMNAEVEGLKIGLVSGNIRGGMEFEAKLAGRLSNASNDLSGGVCVSSYASVVADGSFGLPFINKELGKYTLFKNKIYGNEAGLCFTDIILDSSDIQLGAGTSKTLSVGFLEGDEVISLSNVNKYNYNRIEVISSDDNIATAEVDADNGYIVVTAAEDAQVNDKANFSIIVDRIFGENITKSFTVEITDTGDLVVEDTDENKDEIEESFVDKERKDSEYEVVLSWDDQQTDLDTHFIGFNSSYTEYIGVWYLAYKKILSGNIIELVESNDKAQETLTISKPMEDGTIEYSVHKYTGNSDIKNTKARVQVYYKQKLIRTYNVPLEGEGTIWSVFEFVDGKIVDTNYIRKNN